MLLSELAVTINDINDVPRELSRRETGQAVAEYAFMFAMLLVLVGLMTLVGLHVNRGLNWIGSTIH